MDSRTFFLLGAIATLVFGCGHDQGSRSELTGEQASNELSPRTPKASNHFIEVECQGIELPDHDVQCGWVFLPESPNSDETVAISVARVLSNSKTPQKDPVVYLEGGPGLGSLDDLNWLFTSLSVLAPDRDFIFFDQRGTGRSDPRLDCNTIGGIDGCYNHLRSQVDLNAYRSSNSVEDLEALRQILGYESWNLLGVSYGARLALTAARMFPDAIRSLVLDSVVPLQSDLLADAGSNAFSALERVFEQCAEDDACETAFPDIESKLAVLVEQLEIKPRVVGAYVVDGDAFIKSIAQLMYSPKGVAILPLLIESTSNEDFELYGQLIRGEDARDLALGMHLSVHCAEEVAFLSDELFDTLEAPVPELFRSGLSSRYYLEWCSNWPVEAAPAVENQAVTSDVPALILAGAYDPITPPSYAKLVQRDLRGSSLVLIESEAHAVSAGECAQEIVRSFINNPETTPDENKVKCSRDPLRFSLEKQQLTVPRFDNDLLSEWTAESQGSSLPWLIERPTQTVLDDIQLSLLRRAR